jgi:hypothetical protein
VVIKTQVVQVDQWSKEAAAGLSIALDGCQAQYINEVNNGISQLYKIGLNSWAILRIEKVIKTEELVLVGCCFQGENYLEFSKYIIEKAKKTNIKFIRVHSKRPGIGRWLVNKLGFHIAEKNNIETIYSLKV